MEANKLIQEIIQYVVNNGGDYSGWYIGITNDPRRRLFNDHNVTEFGGAWIHGECATAELARAVEAQLLARGFDGGDGGGDRTATFVYAYKKTGSTRRA